MTPAVMNAETRTASGTFDVQLAPQPVDAGGPAAIGRMTIAKRFHGDLDGTSAGQMVAMMTRVEGSAGYVAMEEVSGTLHGRAGTFVLQHSGTMNRGVAALVVSVVPDSGTGELAGISGSMTIIIAGREHRYEFRYILNP
jgi:hypothetical protein